ncbi:MAG TPA: peptidoglycan DD-metalloendopeptidase family protein [Anaerolineae bacterium]|nr:peptidoglycan DD-metalloendopeptidase family protein [Anaerolineae bacterium]
MKLKHSVLIVIWVLVMATVPLGVAAQQDEPFYRVQQGDTLSGIAHAFGTTVDELIAVNGIANPDLLVPGTVLVIPGYYGLSGYLLTGGEIAFGENTSSLSLRYGVSDERLARLNRWLNPERIYAGQPLILPEEGDLPSELPSSRTLLPVVGETLLELAIREGINPWRAPRVNRHSDRMWIVPGNPLWLDEGEAGTSALPETITDVQIDPQTLVQGNTARVLLTLTEQSWAEGRLGEWSLSFHELEPLQLVALQGVSAIADPGTYDLEIELRASPESPTRYAFRQPIPLIPAYFGYDPVLEVSGVTTDPATIEAEQELWDSIMAEVSPERFWDGPFAFPATRTEVFPSVFGSRRNYNRIGYYTYHTGLDFYSLMGEDITAAASGRVVFAQSLTIRGNSVVLDHGWGVFTAYLHQSRILVSVGDMVEKGQTIGLVGNTGRVAAPHLHWEVVVGGVPVDPMEWTSTAFP